MNNETRNKKKQRFPLRTKLGMICFALIYDGLQLALTGTVVGSPATTIIGVFAFLHFFTWSSIRGVIFLGRTRALTVGPLSFTEMVPAIGGAPLWTVAIIILIITVEIEDQAGIDVHKIGKNIVNMKEIQNLLKNYSTDKAFRKELFKRAAQHQQTRGDEYAKKFKQAGLNKLARGRKRYFSDTSSQLTKRYFDRALVKTYSIPSKQLSNKRESAERNREVYNNDKGAVNVDGMTTSPTK